MIAAFVFTSSLALSLIQTDNSYINVYYNGELINPEVGISLSEITNPKEMSQLSFTLDKDIENRGNLKFEMELTVVRAGSAIRSRSYEGFGENDDINVQPTLHLIKPGDNIVIELTNNLVKEPNLFTIRVTK